MKKRPLLMSTALAASILLSAPSLAFASTVTGSNQQATEGQENNQQVLANKERIDAIFAKMGEEVSQSLMTTQTGGSNSSNSATSLGNTLSATLASELQAQNAQLKNLGVKEITASQAQAIQAENSGQMSPQVTTPPSTSDVDWYSYNYTFYEGSTGKTYDVQELYAQALNGSSNLASGWYGALYQNADWVSSTIHTLASIYVEKLVGDVMALNLITAWAPYELLYPDGTDGNTIDVNEELLSYTSTETVCFAYVQNDGDPSSQEMSYISNMSSIAWSQTFAGWYSDGQPYDHSGTNGTTTTYATDYADPTSEVDAYISPTGSRTRSWASEFVWYNPDRSVSHTQSLIEPAFPAQIY